MKYSKEVEDSIKRSKEIAIETNSNTIRPEHLFLSMIEDQNSKCYGIMREINLNIGAIKQTLLEWTKNLAYQMNVVKSKKNNNISLDPETNIILKNSTDFAIKKGLDEVYSDSVFFCILTSNHNIVNELFKKSPDIYNNLIIILSTNSNNINDDDDMNDEDYNPQEKTDKSTKLKLIEQFGVNLTKLAKEGALDPVVGRKHEIKRVSQILARRKKNNPCLIGEPGVGKTAIAEGIAQLIANDDVPENLKNKKIYNLDMGSLVAGTKYRGEFEQRLRGIIKEMEENNDIILFIDEIHTIIGAGSAQGTLDASNMLKPALSRGGFQCIGATTLEEYRKYIEKDGALERRFQKVLIEPTNKEETLEILKNLRERYEDFHMVKYTDDALESCVNLTDKYMSDKCLPDKAIDAMDEAGSKVHINKVIETPKNILDLENKIKKVISEKEKYVNLQKFELAAKKRDSEKELNATLIEQKEKWKNEISKNRDIVTQKDIAEVISLMTKIPIENVSTDENNKLKVMSEKMKNVVIGQDEAVDKLVRSVKRSRIGIKDPSKPIGSFIFLGPTGVGKTYLAKVMAKELFGSEDAMIRIDMSEYMEKHNVSRLVGAPPGYVGYEDGGELTEAVRRKPYSIILLDEIEKAHSDVQNILLQLLDDGVLTDSYGRRVDFKNTIIIMTSNAGSRKLDEFGTGIGFNVKSNVQEDKNSIIEKELKKVFSPEFINRIDDIVMFNSLSRENINNIIDVELKSTLERLKNSGYSVEITDSIKKLIYEKGYDEKFGARPLKRAIQKYIEDKLTDSIINEEIKVGDSISLIYDESVFEVKVNILSSKSIKDTNDNLLIQSDF